MTVGIEVDPHTGEVTAYDDARRVMAIGRDEATARRRLAAIVDPGYATENVEPITALDRDAIEAMWAATMPGLHQHNAYGWAGCPVCRRMAAERVSARFPATHDDTLSL